ncbi:cell division protein FtsQ/DivIB [Pseudochelatococcus contaminans]|uniref:Cell division protein FtsQ n=1 Tax=Pseudochelatococcus contaminans TaxID=1538103 RepID=A0A7W5Z1Q7_9HYPH|nr:cell division protein FtsQ/DivIB [Pseudochelatococcus contaminans]MBB3808260.1 cell division protein FtsQ [Pseudochelatococcus contaminans]
MAGRKFFSRRRTEAPRVTAGDRRALRLTPFDRAARYMPRGTGSGLMLALFATVATYGALRGGHLDEFRATYGEPYDAVARLFGLGIDEVHISGIVELRESEVLAAAGVGPLRSLAFLDASEVRKRLESVPMIRQASVSKLYPDALSIGIVEREPQALWQRNGEVFVIAGDGTVIDLMTDPRFARLPFVAGEGANMRAEEYIDIVKAAGPLAQRIRAGILVSGRRWDIKFDNDLIVRLPEIEPVAAMTRLVDLERRETLLNKDLIAIDMRQNDRMSLRLSEEGAAAMIEARKKTGKRKAPET